MIKKIVLNNVASHVKTELNLEQFNAIIGSSGTGKSAVMRGLESIFLFKTFTARFDETDSSIALVCDGISISRNREDKCHYECIDCQYVEKELFKYCPVCNSRNIDLKRTKVSDTYLIEKDNGDVERYTKMGRGYAQLSDDVKTKFPIGCIMIGGTKPYFPGFRSQYGEFVWDQLSGAEFSQLISSMEGSDYVEIMIRQIKKEYTGDKRELTRLKEEYQFIKRELVSDKSELDKKRTAFEELDEQADEAKDIFSRIISANVLKNEILEVQDVISHLRTAIKAVKVIKIDEVEVGVTIDRLRQMRGGVETWKTIHESMVTLEDDIKELGSADTTAIEDLIVTIRAMKSLRKEMAAFEKECHMLKTDLNNVVSEQADLEKEIKEKFIDEDICPFTGWKLSAACKKQMI